jgi:hypothetical protein
MGSLMPLSAAPTPRECPFRILDALVDELDLACLGFGGGYGGYHNWGHYGYGSLFPPEHATSYCCYVPAPVQVAVPVPGPTVVPVAVHMLAAVPVQQAPQ